MRGMLLRDRFPSATRLIGRDFHLMLCFHVALQTILFLTFACYCPCKVNAQNVRSEEPVTASAKQTNEEGFEPLFDGRTLAGWNAVPEISASDWSVHDGAIVGIGSADRLAYLVWKDYKLTDFELRFRYRMLTKGNTGVEIRAIPDVSRRRPFEGYHADIGHVGIGPNVLGAWDFHFAKRTENQRKEHPCPLGTRLVIDENDIPQATKILNGLTDQDVHDQGWNDVRIIATGNHFEFFINGKLASEFTDNLRFGRLDQGAIGLQLHNRGMRVEFKDLRIKAR